MRKLFHTLDVFTDQRFGGNPLGVVLDADGLSGDEMQRIAAEFNLSETTFVLPPDDPANTARVRIFTPASELPFAGHPTIGTAILLAELGEGNDVELRLEEKVGVIQVAVKADAGGAGYATLSAAAMPGVADMPSSDAKIAAALGLDAADIGFETHHPGLIEAGVRILFVPVADLDALMRAQAVSGPWRALDETPDCVGLYPYTRSNNDAGFRSRLFAPDQGIAEDPATGAAATLLPAQVHIAETLSDGTHAWQISQGYEMGRPSELFVAADVEGGAITGVRVGGHAVRVMEGSILVR